MNQETKTPGALYILLGKITFMVTSYVIYFCLSRILTPSEFGNYGIVIGVVSVLNMIFIRGSLQAVSKFVSEHGMLKKVLSKALLVQILMGTLFFFGLFMGAGFLSEVFQDDGLKPYFQIASLITLCYAFYSIYVGGMNGLKWFKMQGLFDVAYAILKMVLILVLAQTALGLTGAFLGFASSAFLIMIAAMFVISRYQGSETNTPSLPLTSLFHFQLSTMAFAFTLHLILHMDLFVLKSFSESTIANSEVGYYAAGLTLSRISFMLLTSLNIIMFPLISKATYDQDKESVNKFIMQAFRISLLLVLPIACVLSSNARELLGFVYPANYGQGYQALEILSFGYVFIALFLTSTSVLISSHRPKIALAVAVIALAIQALICRLLIPQNGAMGAALGTTVGLFFGFVLCFVCVSKLFHWGFPLKRAGRILICSVLIYFLGKMLPMTGWMILVEVSLLFGLYMAILILFKELGKQDIDYLRNLLCIKTKA